MASVTDELGLNLFFVPTMISWFGNFKSRTLTTHRGSQTGRTLPFPEGIQGVLPI